MDQASEPLSGFKDGWNVDMNEYEPEPEFDTLIVGAGAAGVGAAVALLHAGVGNFGIVERQSVGASFNSWPAETRFITPSFPTNSVGMVDINSVVPGASPGYSMKLEHPTGQEYAEHLRDVALHYDLPINENTEVDEVVKTDEGFLVKTSRGALKTKHLIWAAGEFQYPKTDGFTGSTLCQHTATIPNYRDLDGDEFIIIGGCESGVDAAYHLALQNKRVKLFDIDSPWEMDVSEPSITLSPFSFERMRHPQFIENVELHGNCQVAAVEHLGTKYQVLTSDGECFETGQAPLLAHGFDGSHKLVSQLFEKREDGYPLLNEQDESTIAPGLFLCGPAVRHENLIFCFIYKYRQRFAVVAKTIADSLGLPAEGLEVYRSYGMYLDDLSCCGKECIC